VANSYPKSNRPRVKFGKETLMVNATIKDDKNEACNAPWVIDLESLVI
jgi:hypothetical protein